MGRPLAAFLSVLCAALIATGAGAKQKGRVLPPGAATGNKGNNPDLTRLLSDAEEYLLTGDYERALQVFRFACRKAPADARPHLGIGRLYFLTNRSAESLAELTKACTLDPQSASAHFELGLAYLSLGKSSLARPEIEKAVAIDPARAEFHYKLAQLKDMDGRTQGALAEFARVIELDPEHAGARLALARRLSVAGLVDGAIAQCQEALKTNARDPDLWYQLGTLYERQEKPVEAISAFRQAMKLNPRDPRSAERLAIVYGARQDWPNAYDAASSWCEIEPDSASAHFARAWSAMSNRELPEARDSFERAIVLDKTNPELFNAYGLLLSDMGKAGEAEKAFANALSLSPGHLPASLNMVMLRLESKDLVDAGERIKTILARAPEAPGVLSLAALVNARTGDIEVAEARATLALSRNEKDALARIAYATVLRNQGDKQKQLAELNKAYAQSASNVFVANELAAALLENEEARRAGEIAQQVLQIAPANIKGKHTLALALGKQGNWDGAILLLYEVVGRKPKDASFRVDLARALEMRGKDEEAETEFKKASELDDKAISPLTGLAGLALSQKRPGQALAYLDKALAVSPSDTDALFLKGEALYEKGKLDSALEIARLLLDRSPESRKINCLAGRILCKKRSWQAAVTHLKVCLEGPTAPPGDWLMAAYALEKANDLSGARQILRSAVAAYPDNHSLKASLQRVSSRLR